MTKIMLSKLRRDCVDSMMSKSNHLPLLSKTFTCPTFFPNHLTTMMNSKTSSNKLLRDHFKENTSKYYKLLKNQKNRLNN